MSASGGPAQYEIRVAGVLDDRWAAWFDGLQISGQGEETVICGLVADQPALHGLRPKSATSGSGRTRTAMRGVAIKSGQTGGRTDPGP